MWKSKARKRKFPNIFYLRASTQLGEFFMKFFFLVSLVSLFDASHGYYLKIDRTCFSLSHSLAYMKCFIHVQLFFSTMFYKCAMCDFWAEINSQKEVES